MRELFVAKAFAEKSVFITGATGFLGKVLVEKLLRDCSEIDKIYILLRSKKDEKSNERFENYKRLTVFEKLNKCQGNTLKKLVPIEGDLMVSPSVGISDANLQLIKENISFVFHCAASVKFDEPLKNAIKMNTISTRNMLDLAEKCQKLEGFVHVSTAFSNTDKNIIHEKVYEPIYSYKTAIAFVEMNRDDDLSELNDFAMKTFPNTYVFSKNLTEKLVSDRSAAIPLAIVRPSIVCPSYKEPYPGWVDSYNGPMGVLIGAGSGILRTVHGDGDMIPDLIPCDLAVNAIIVAGASVATSENKTLQVFNCTSSTQLPITWNQFLDLSLETYKNYPSMAVIWLPGGQLCSNYYVYVGKFILLQLLPACLIDFGLLVTGRKVFAIKLQMKIFDSIKVFEYFLSRSWEWNNRNFEILHQLVSLNER